MQPLEPMATETATDALPEIPPDALPEEVTHESRNKSHSRGSSHTPIPENEEETSDELVAETDNDLLLSRLCAAEHELLQLQESKARLLQERDNATALVNTLRIFLVLLLYSCLYFLTLRIFILSLSLSHTHTRTVSHTLFFLSLFTK